MAHTFSLTDGGTTVILTQAFGYIVTVYDMSTAEDSKDDGLAEPEITESLDVLVIASSDSTLRALVRSVETIFVSARRRQNGEKGSRVYLQAQIGTESNTWRAEIIDGRFKPDKDTLESWSTGKTPYHLMVTHRAWEGPRTELAISSATSSTPATGGKPIVNGLTNYITIANTALGGVLPTPIELQLTNTSGASVDYRNFYLCTNAFSDPINFDFDVEGEARRSGYGTITSVAGASGGAYNAYSFTSNGEIQWDLSSTMMQDTQGRNFQLMVRMFGWSGVDVYVQPLLKDSGNTTVLYEGDEQKLPSTSNSRIINLGSMPLPNGSYFTSYAATILSLKLRATGAATFNVDFIHLMSLDSYQYVVQNGLAIPNGGTITFDNIEGVFHYGGNSLYSPRVGALKVFPNITNRIHILYDESASSTPARTMTVRAYVRERRLTV